MALGGYGPGGAPNLTPANTGIYLPPGGSFAWQMHYTATGKPLNDKTEAGYYFYKEEPKYLLRQASITDFSLRDPAGRAASPRDRLHRDPAGHPDLRHAAALPLALLFDQAAHPLPGWHGEDAAEPAALRLRLAARIPLRPHARSAQGTSLLIADYVYDNSDGQRRSTPIRRRT